MCYGSENCTVLRMRSTMSAGERIEALDYGLRFFAEDRVNRKPQLLGLAAQVRILDGRTARPARRRTSYAPARSCARLILLTPSMILRNARVASSMPQAGTSAAVSIVV
jgi:hypothetical protein